MGFDVGDWIRKDWESAIVTVTKRKPGKALCE